MSSDLIVDVEGLIGRPEAVRPVSGHRHVSLRLGDVTVEGVMEVEGTVRGTVDGVLADFEARAPAHLECVRCLTEWVGEVSAVGTQHFSHTPDEDGYRIEDRHIDLGGPATDELSLALPAVPLCREDCRGLCPICGTDLNMSPCDGHGEESDSPFAALKDLFDS